MSKAKANTTTKTLARPLAQQPDAAIVTACIAYAMHTAAGMAAHNADPDGNSENAKPYSDKLWNKAECALIDATAQAHTLMGIRAKARLLARIQQDEGSLATLYGCEVQFARSVGRDVEALLSKWQDLSPMSSCHPHPLAVPAGA